MQTTTYKLNVTPGGVPLTIHISQYDVGLRQYIFQPYTSEGEFTYVSGATVTLEATKPDGYAVIHECTYNQDGSITYTVQAQLAAKAGRVWSKVVIRNGNNILGTGAVVWMVDNAGVKDNAIVSDSDISALQQWMANVEDYSEAAASSASLAESAVTSAQAAATQAAGYVDQAVILGGTPLVAATVSAMSDHDRVYVYTGSETGYTAGNWYYWNGSAWTSGGIYNSSAVQTDPTLSVSGMAADAAATGELKNEIKHIETDIYTTSDITLNTQANGWILNGTGLSTVYTDGCIRKYEVIPGQLIYLDLIKDNVGGVYQFQSNASVGSTSNPYVIGDPVTTSFRGFVTVPTGATWLITSQLKTNSTNKVQSMVYEAFAKKSEIIDQFNVNLVDFDDSTDSKYINPSTGGESTNSSFTAYGFIPVTGGTAYTVSAANAYYGAFYDSSKTFITGSGIQQNINGEHTIAYTAPTTAKYMRISCQTAQITTLSVYIASDYDIVLNDSIYVHEENIIPAPTTVTKVTPSDNLVSVFLNNAGKELYVTGGTYDIIQHYKDYYGNDYFTNYVGYNTTGKIEDGGLPIKRDTIVHFAPDAILTCIYTGSNANVKAYFSAFALYGGVTLDGLNLTASGVRSAIHDDFDNTYNGITCIKNCIINSDVRCIAGGMHSGSQYLIENNLFNTTDTTGYDVTYHNYNSATAKNAMVVTGNYFNNGISLRYAGTSTSITEVLVSNNSMAKAIQHTAESSSMTVDNIDIKEWNNVIRS